MNPADFEKLLKLLALIQQGLVAVNEILVNKASQGGMDEKALSDRAEEHTKEALDIINAL